MGQSHTFRAQPVRFFLTQLSAFPENTCCNAGGERSGGIIPVHRIFQRAGSAAVQGFHHAGIGAVAMPHFRNAENPEMVTTGLVVTALSHRPFLLRQMYIPDERCHFSIDLSAGHAQQHTVAGKGRKLRVGGDFRIAVAQVITHQAIGTVIFLNLLPCFGIHRITHGIADGKSQQTAAICILLRNHTVPLLRLICLHYTFCSKKRQEKIRCCSMRQERFPVPAGSHRRN